MSLRRSALAAAAALALVGAAGCTADSVFDLSVGDCLNQSDLEGDEISSVKALDCETEEHDAEVYAEHVYAEGDYPGNDAVREKAEHVCAEEFETFMGISYLESALLVVPLTPSEDSWNNADDRTALCIVLYDEPQTGSLEGAQV
ncbi:MAG TPA: septum formation family protein [Brevibacterium sp.]|nr:septum formation family protein [Brevibacterium sp.]